MANEEKPFRIRPRHPLGQRHDEVRVWSAAFKRLFHLVRMSRRSAPSRGTGQGRRAYSQRCAVRVSYSTNRTPGQWRAHGRYLARESARSGEGKTGNCFGPAGDAVKLSRTLGQWQINGDERMFKIILSPEFGERVDLETLTKDFVGRVERDLGTALDWAAVTHFNTGHPHVHIALRGVDDRGQALRFERDYIRVVMRRHAENLCTSQIGFRSTLDAEEAQRREIDQLRYTSLDRIIHRPSREGENPAESSEAYFEITVDPNNTAPEGPRRVQQFHVASRLIMLEKMGLAERDGFATWRVRRDFEQVLGAMQRANDRQKTLAAHGALLSDQRLPLQLTSPTAVAEIEGRVLGHGQEDTSGRPYILIEGTDAKVHFISYDESIDTARHRGLMHVNSFVRLYRNRGNKLVVQDLGDAEKILNNKDHMRDRARRSIKTGTLLHEASCWGGWLGRYHAKLHVESAGLRNASQARGVQSLPSH